MEIGISDDYAVLDVGDWCFYYGYEVKYGEQTDEWEDDREWCFEAKKDNVQVALIPQSQLEIALGNEGKFECTRMLMAGIGLLMERGILKLGS